MSLANIPTVFPARSSAAALIWLLSLAFRVHSGVPDESNLSQSCLLGKNHKDSSGPEDFPSNSACDGWKSRSCCTAETARNITSLTDGDLYLGLNWDHCEGRTLSDACRDFFKQDTCFYECSPNVAPWIVEDKRKMRRNRFKGIPLCASDCQKWFAACQNDYTCVENWSKDFVWKTGQATCPKDSSCQTFKEKFKTEQDFCEKIFDGSFRYTYDSQPCMRLTFNGTLGNPNDRIEQWQLGRIRRGLVPAAGSDVLAGSSKIVLISVVLLLPLLR